MYNNANIVLVGNEMQVAIIITFSLQQTGHHVFAADSTAEMDSWVDAINSAIKEDRARQKKASSKSKLSASAATGEAQSANSVVDRSRQGETNPSELMGKINDISMT